MSSLEYVHLHPAGLNPCTLQKQAYEAAARTWLCTGCGAPKPTGLPVDAEIQEERPGDIPLTFVNGCGLIIARLDLIEELEPVRARAELLIGRVTGPSGRVMPDWVTLRGRERVIIRGSTNVAYRRCDQCGRHVYFAMGERYLFPAPKGDCLFYESDLCGLVVDPVILRNVELRRWPGLGVEFLQVLREPRDSLGELQ